jgi:hypothetical protein
LTLPLLCIRIFREFNIDRGGVTMKKGNENSNSKSLQRRSFLKLAGLSFAGLSMGFPRWGHAAEKLPEITGDHKHLWHTDANGNLYFVPINLKTDKVDQSKVKAKVDDEWKTYPVREFDDEFHTWWIDEKNWYYDQLIAFFEGQSDEMNIPNGGHHHPMLCTYGVKKSGRGDSEFHLNCSPKGFALLPKPENIQYIEDQINAIYNDSNADLPVDVFKKRQELYQQKDLWDKTRFATLELYSGRPINATDQGDGAGCYGFKETHTFANVMDNPMATLTYMALFNTDGTQSYFQGLPDETPTFEFRGFSWMISYYNPGNTEYEKLIADYINQAHCQYHGGSCDIATNIFLISEQFNNSPGDDPYGRGKRTIPSFSYDDYYDVCTETRPATIYKPKSAKKLTKEEKIALIKKLRIPV